MNKQIRRSKFTKVMACYLAMMILLQMVQPMQLYALTEGPSQPEFNSFTPIGTSDMVDLASGDFNYNIPIMDVGGYPINLAYNSGVTMDQEASWVGLGWNLNVGQINRNVRGLPDDFKGDIIETENNLKDNVTVGVNPYINAQIIGMGDGPALMFGAGLDVQFNNYTGMSAVPSFGPTFKFADYVSIGMQLSSSVDEGASITPSVSLSTKKMNKDTEGSKFGGNLSANVTYNSRQGLQSFNLSSTLSYQKNACNGDNMERRSATRSGSGSISYVNNTFTPTKRLSLKNNNFRFSFSTGIDLWGGHIEGSIAGYASIQKLIDKKQFQTSYGYENTDLADGASILDFNREKEQSIVSKNTLVLPVTNYTYDIYTIQGQGIGGMFRPFRGQVGMVFDPLVADQSSSMSAGLEIEGGGGVHKGLNFRVSNTNSYTAGWNTVATPFFKEKTSGNEKDYEKVYFKNIGETRADPEYNTILQKVGDTLPVALKIDDNKNAVNVYRKKYMSPSESLLDDGTTFNTQIKRQHREQRNQVIQKITKGEAKRFGLSPYINYNTETIIDHSGIVPVTIPVVKEHHTAGYIVTDENGTRNIYGETVYNMQKKEVTFNVGTTSSISYKDGLVKYLDGDNTSSNRQGRDHYFNGIKTPPYAHTYLLTSVLSSDYQDLTANGISDDDLGSYTKFTYSKMSNYKWRIPYGKTTINNAQVNSHTASYNEGLKTDKLDQKGSYLYGVKENKYLKRIETKTHVAFIDLDERRDGMGVDGENGNSSASSPKMYKIKTIRLYSKPEAIKALLMDDYTENDLPLEPIKTAHFEYDYSLCKGIDNNSGLAETANGVNINTGKGKLTLKKVYFTYKGSKMGKYTPYVFNYENNNPDYNVKAYDIWGNYKPFKDGSWAINSTETTPQEFPYVDQTDRDSQNAYAAAWSLSSIKLPSGGKINITYEADDYKFVQDKRAMQMFKIDGVTHDPASYAGQTNKDKLYSKGYPESNYVAIKLPVGAGSEQEVRKKYTEGLVGKPIYFNFLLNMTVTDYDYVTGYFVMNGEAVVMNNYLFIPMKPIKLDGDTSGSVDSNPITVAGCFFGRQNVNLQINGKDDPGGADSFNIIDVGKDIWKNLDVMSELFTGANGRLKKMHVARTFFPNKSWIRLLEPSGFKIGGGARVKKVVMLDEWDKMLAPTTPPNSTDIGRYAKQYGQEYTYTSEDGFSSGVATYEPNICKENPLVVPFYHVAEKLSAQTYQEEPFGESFFPSPTVTYSRVTVKNIAASNSTTTGKVVTQHFTTKDFPTITDFTNLDESNIYASNEKKAIEDVLGSLLGLKVNATTDLTMSQGFVIKTNDMNGKLKMQEVFDHSGEPISYVQYVYSTNENGTELNNKLPTIDENGLINRENQIATQYDVVNDLRESYSQVTSSGLGINIDMIPLGIFPLIIGLVTPESSEIKQILRTAVTTKVIHKSGILKEKIAYDLGSTVSTKNHAWDAKTGQVILTETVNEFNDQYYSFNYPAYWNYKSIGMASQNADLTGRLSSDGLPSGFFGMDGEDMRNYLKPGDELLMWQPDRKVWVAGYSPDFKGVSLMKANGQKLYALQLSSTNFNDRFRVLRSSHRNQQMTSMASITLMRNPLLTASGGLREDINSSFLKTPSFDPRVINASAVEYKELWESQCENNLPQPNQSNINQYLYNIKGNWRPVKSYAYLTGRSNSNMNIRRSGFFTTFVPFYKRNSHNTAWEVNQSILPIDELSKWTFASEVTKYNPYGIEIENKDALWRFSSAQYGYQYKLPIAVASNSTYAEMGFDGFEDYGFTSMIGSYKTHFGFSQSIRTGVVVTGKTSHTGKKSIEVGAGNHAKLKRKIKGCE